MKSLTIGQVAQRAGVGIETVRFYERKGLIAEPPRTASGYRQYDKQAISRLRFIRKAGELGFTLAEIGELLSLRSSPESSCGDVKSRAEAKIADINERIRSLRQMKQALAKLTKACSGQGTAHDCPILEALGSGEKN